MIAEGRPPAGAAVPSPAITDLELQLLLEAVYRISGHDFRDFAPATLRRRVQDRVRAENVATLSGLQERVLHDPAAMERFVDAVTFNASSPFGEPAFFAEFTEHILPRLRTYPYVRIWVAGCGAADDAYGLAIVCRETGFANRVRIYATDSTESALERARAGVVLRTDLDEVNRRYRRAGGTARFEDYLEVDGLNLRYRDDLRANIVFAQHNLVSDGSFNDFHLVVAGRALAKYNRNLAYHPHQVMYESLVRLGFLGMGANETLRFTPHQKAYDIVPNTESFYRRIR